MNQTWVNSPMEMWAVTLIFAAIGFFFIIMTYGALIQSYRTKKYVSGVPFVGGIIVAISFLLSPIKLLALLGLLDYGVWMVPVSIVKNFISDKKVKKESK